MYFAQEISKRCELTGHFEKVQKDATGGICLKKLRFFTPLFSKKSRRERKASEWSACALRASADELFISIPFIHSLTAFSKTFLRDLSEWYAYDAAGSVMAIYKYDENDGTPTFALTEYPVTGMGRIGNFDKAAAIMNYELTDHLGNVRVSVKYAGLSGVQTVAQVQSWNDYYAFGGLMPGRKYVSTAYRFNYQGNEKDLDLNANENWVNFQLRLFNPDLGRWMSPDPYSQFHSPYVGMGNNPISGVDPDGGFAHYYTTASGGVYFGWALQKRWNDQWNWANVNNPDNFVRDNEWAGSNQGMGMGWIDDDQFTLDSWAQIDNEMTALREGEDFYSSWGESRRGGMYLGNSVYQETAFTTHYVGYFGGSNIGFYDSYDAADNVIGSEYLKYARARKQYLSTVASTDDKIYIFSGQVIINASSKSVAYKPEKGNAVKLVPGGTLVEVEFDGVATGLRSDMVFKVYEGGDVYVNNRGEVKVGYMGTEKIEGDLASKIRGFAQDGWRTRNEMDAGWQDLFDWARILYNNFH